MIRASVVRFGTASNRSDTATTGNKKGPRKRALALSRYFELSSLKFELRRGRLFLRDRAMRRERRNDARRGAFFRRLRIARGRRGRGAGRGDGLVERDAGADASDLLCIKRFAGQQRFGH